MTDSFVFYKSFYKSIALLDSDSEKWEIIQALCELAFNGKEADDTEFSDMQKVIYYISEKQIKASVQHKVDGAKGGKKKSENNKPSLISRGVEMGVEKGGNVAPLPSNVNVNVNVNDNVNDNVNVNEFDPRTPLTSQYSKTLFNIFKDAGLPCGKENEITFLQTDFNNAVGFIRKSETLHNFHAEDIIKACNNYVKLISDPNTWSGYKHKLSFYSLVQKSWFYELIQDNLDFFKSHEKTTKTQSIKILELCPSCSQKTVDWSNEKQKYFCGSCHKEFEFEELNG